MSSEVVEERYSRHSDMIDVERLKTLPIRIIGAGSVGSFTCLALSKMGAQNIKAWDDDMIDEVNIGNQFYRMEDVGEYKVEALQKMIMDFEGVPIETESDLYDGTVDCDGIIIMAVDNMTARKRIWEKVKGNDKVSLMIDPRMGAKVARIYTVNPMEYHDYEDSLYSDEEATEERCTERTIIYTVMGIAGLICRQIESYMNGNAKDFEEIIFDYQTYYMSHVGK